MQIKAEVLTLIKNGEALLKTIKNINTSEKIASRQFCFFCCQKKKATAASEINKTLFYR